MVKKEKRKKTEGDTVFIYLRHLEYEIRHCGNACVACIAPNATKKKWKTADAIGVYCTECKTKVNYDSGKNPLGIKRHMAKYHQKLLDNYDDYDAASKKRKAVGVDAFFPKKPKTSAFHKK